MERNGAIPFHSRYLRGKYMECKQALNQARKMGNWGALILKLRVDTNDHDWVSTNHTTLNYDELASLLC